MKYFLSILFIFSLNLVSPLLAQDKNSADMSALLENKIWKVQLPKDKHYAMEMEFRSAGWKQTFLYDEKQTEICDSYSLHGDTIKSFQKNYIIQELTDSTLVLQYLPESLTIGVTPVRCTTDNSVQGQRQNEERLDSIWCKEDIWNKGVAKITGEPIKDLSTIEPPRWAVWDYDLTKYYVSQMKYPEELLKKNVAGYSVVMFALDTLGLPRWNTILTTIHKDFDKEVIRLTKELPHCLPCRDKNGKRMECLYTVYVPFLPQHYRDRVKADSIGEEELKQSFVEWEAMSYFEKANPYAVTNYINERLTYDSKLLNGKTEIKGIYTIRIDSYGEITEVETLRGCGIQEWDNQVLQIIKGMPRWTPTINFHGKGEYRNSVWTVPVLFKNDSPTKNEVNNYNWLIKTLSKSCKYPPKLQKKNREGMVYVTYKLDGNGYITNPQVISCNNRKFKRAALNAFNAVTGISITLPAPKDTLVFQFKLDRPTTPINPHTDVLIISYSSCDTPILMRYDATLIAHTTEPYLEVGVPVCYLNERGDTIVPYGKYRYCQTDTIKKIGFVYENKPKDARIICINDAGKELFYVFKYDNGPDYTQEGLFRIMDEDGLIGFADSLGNVIIEPQFKFAYPFKGGKTKVTLEGEQKEVPKSEGEKHYWESGTWFYIDKRNKHLTD
ncbi:Gram-negative bacterial TonB protein C-terminal [Bacteroides salyersiae]|uniref:energy transducer TonB n=1 Tax=Bacteroides salyersiae TaxID=291644 RepID=UPI001B8C623E|nr:energy transducer TonB [Bacteroides salyersiae]QUT74633.1 Gram-negative bacterial TonB protein C-terminal [Bacteroides salyersiae]